MLRGDECAAKCAECGRIILVLRGASITGVDPCVRGANHSRHSDWVVRHLARQSTVASKRVDGVRPANDKKKSLRARL